MIEVGSGQDIERVENPKITFCADYDDRDDDLFQQMITVITVTAVHTSGFSGLFRIQGNTLSATRHSYILHFRCILKIMPWFIMNCVSLNSLYLTSILPDFHQIVFANQPETI